MPSKYKFKLNQFIYEYNSEIEEVDVLDYLYGHMKVSNHRSRYIYLNFDKPIFTGKIMTRVSDLFSTSESIFNYLNLKGGEISDDGLNIFLDLIIKESYLK